jgi:hypothetical protein
VTARHDTFVAGYETAGGTTALGPRQSPESQSPVGRWVHSDEARAFEGLWVLLDETLHPLDHDLSPLALRERNPGRDDALIVYVQPLIAHLDV